MVARHLKACRRLATLYCSCNLVAVYAERAALPFGYIKAHRNRIAEQYLSAARHRLPVHACRNAAGKRQRLSDIFLYGSRAELVAPFGKGDIALAE